MKRANKIKALFLLVVFSLNTLVGLACSVGFRLDVMLDNNVQTAHAHGNPHQHETLASHAHDNGEFSGKEHSHEAVMPPHQHDTTDTHDSEKKDDCCSDEVVQLSLLDKALTSHKAQIPVPSNAVIFTLYAFFLTNYNYDFSLLKLKPPDIRSWPLATHTDLRIAIQSFQI